MGLTAAYGRRGVRYNKAENVFRVGNGAVIEVGQLDGPTAYSKYQGRSFTLLVVDEIGLIRELRRVRLLRSNLRAAEGVPLREVRTANPGGVQHAALVREHVNAAPPWAPYETPEGEVWVNAPSTYDDNPHLDGAAYVRRLRAPTAGDEDLLRAWTDGDWNIAGGAMFGDIWDPEIHILPSDFRPTYRFKGQTTALGLDWGSAAPAMCLLGLKTPGDDVFPKGSPIVLDEVPKRASPNRRCWQRHILTIYY